MRRYGLWCGSWCALVLLVGLLAVPTASALQNYTQVEEWGAGALGASATLRDIAADPGGGLWVAADTPACDPSPEANAVFKLDSDGSTGQVINLSSSDPGCIGLAPGGDIYMYDLWNPGNISIFTTSGNLADTIYDSDRLQTVTGIAFDSSGDSYFANNYWQNYTRRRDYSDEATYERVWKFDGDSFVAFGDASDPSAPGWIDQPKGAAVDSGGNVYISSYWNGVGTLKEFDSNGNYLATIPRDGAGGNVEAAWIPGCLATDSADNVYALDTYGESDAVVHKFDSAGNLLATIDTGTDMSAGLAVDANGNVCVGDARNNVIRVFAPAAEDTTAPTCVFSFGGAAGDNGWYTSTGDAVVSATDNEGGSGVASIHCAVDGIEQPAADIVPPVGGPVTAGFTISTEGKHTVTYWAVDDAGNESEHQSADVWIDTIAPAGTFAIDGGAATTHSTSVTGDSAVTDANGVEMNFSVDGESWTGWLTYAASEPLTLPDGDGTKTVEAEYRDPAGNELDLSASIVLDTTVPTDVTAPTVTIDNPLEGAVYPSYPTVQPLTLDFNVDDEAGGSGTDISLWHASVTWPDGQTTPVPLTPDPTSSDAAVGPLPTSEQGDYTVTITASDAAGNQTTATVSYSVAGGWSGLLGLPPDTNGDGLPDIDSYSTSPPLTLKFRLVSSSGAGLTKAQRCLQGRRIRNAKPRLYVWDVATHTLRFRAHKRFHREHGGWYVYRWDTTRVNWDPSWPRGQYRRMLLVIKLYDAHGSGFSTVRLLMPRAVRNSTRARAKRATDAGTLVSFRKMMTRDL